MIDVQENNSSADHESRQWLSGPSAPHGNCFPQSTQILNFTSLAAGIYYVPCWVIITCGLKGANLPGIRGGRAHAGEHNNAYRPPSALDHDSLRA